MSDLTQQPVDHSLLAIVETVMEAWGRHDLDGVLAPMSDDIEWHYHVGSRPVVGKEAMRKVLEKLAAHQLDSAWRVIRHATRPEPDGRVALFVEAVDDYRSPDDRRVVVPYAGVYEFDGETVVAWRDYVDLGLMQRAQAGEDLGPWVAALVSRPRAAPQP